MFINVFFLLLIFNISVASRHIFKRNVLNRNALHFFDHTDPDHEYEKTHKDHLSNSNAATIKNVKGIFLCGSDKMCEKITEVEIAHNISFDCYEKHLPINYKSYVTLPNGTDITVNAHGFLKKDKPLINSVQATSKVCYQIKRYFNLKKISRKNSKIF